MKDTIKKLLARKRSGMGSSNEGLGENGETKSSSKVPLLTGTDAFITLEKGGASSNTALIGMQRITSRKSFYFLHPSFYKKPNIELAVYVEKATTRNVRSVRLACDAYLSIGFRKSIKFRSAPVVVFGGDYDDEDGNVEVLVFNKGELIEVTESRLSLPSSPDYDDMLDALISNYKSKYMGCLMVQCANLPRWNRPEISKYYTDKIFKSLRPVDLNPTKNPIKLYGTPALLLVLSSLSYVYVVGIGFASHSSLIAEAKQLEAKMYQLSDERVSIEIMEARESFKNAVAGEEVSYIEDIKKIAQAVSTIDGGIIRGIRAPGGDSSVAAYLSISVPLIGSDSPLLQARLVLDQLVNNTGGYSMRLSQSQSITTNADRVTFHIEVLHG